MKQNIGQVYGFNLPVNAVNLSVNAVNVSVNAANLPVNAVNLSMNGKSESIFPVHGLRFIESESMNGVHGQIEAVHDSVFVVH